MSSQGAYTYFGRDFPDQVITKPKLRLNYGSTADVAVGLSLPLNTWTNVDTAKTFTVEDAASIVEVLISGSMSGGGNASAHTISARIVIDGITNLKLGGVGVTAGATNFSNPLAGVAPVYMTGLATGIHTIQLQLRATVASTLYLRSSALPDAEFLNMQVIEHQRANAGGEFISANPVIQAHRNGLFLAWTTPGTNHNNVSVGSGSCYIPSEGKVISTSTAITPPSSTTLSASTHYYVYGYNNGGVLALDPLSTIAPDPPYSGTARTKAGDNTRRYLGQVLTNTTPAIISFRHLSDNSIVYDNVNPVAAPFAVATSLPPGAEATLNLSGALPPNVCEFARMGGGLAISTTGGLVWLNFNLGAAGMRVAETGATISTAGGIYIFTIDVPLNSATPSFLYMFAGPAGSTCSFRCTGYKYAR